MFYFLYFKFEVFVNCSTNTMCMALSFQISPAHLTMSANTPTAAATSTTNAREGCADASLASSIQVLVLGVKHVSRLSA